MKVNKLWFDSGKIFILTDNGSELWQSLLWYPRLQHATEEQRQKYTTDSEGIRWDELDEDISFESFLYENPEPVGIAKVFREHPELNVSAVSRRLGMQQSLLAAYVSGNKKPSAERENQILNILRSIGNELSQIQFVN